MKKKPSEDELAAFMAAYAPRAFELYSTKPFPVNWPLEAARMIDYFEETAAPNGDWLRGKGRRVKDWKRTAQRWVRTAVEYQLENRSKVARPVIDDYEPPKPKRQTPEAARAAIELFQRGEA